MMSTLMRFLALGILVVPSLLLGQAKMNIVGGEKITFGDVYSGVVAKKVVTIRNDGTDTLIISNVSASCGCTGTLMANDHVLPGDSTALEITFNTKKFTGWVDKSISLNSNDPKQQSQHIWFNVHVIKTVEADPEYLYYHTGLDSSATQSITVRNPSSETVRILSVTSTSDVVSAKAMKDVLKPGEETTVDCVLTPKTSGTFKGNITIKTDHPKVPVLDVRFFGLVSNKKTSSSLKQN